MKKFVATLLFAVFAFGSICGCVLDDGFRGDGMHGDHMERRDEGHRDHLER